MDGLIPGNEGSRHEDEDCTDSHPVTHSVSPQSPDLRMSCEDVSRKTATDETAEHVDRVPGSGEPAATGDCDRALTTDVPDPETGIPALVTTRDRKVEKAKQKRIERRIQRTAKKKDCSLQEAESLVREAHQRKVDQLRRRESESLERLLQPPANAKHKIEVRFVSTSFDHGDEEMSGKEKTFADTILPIEHAVYAKYQTKVHGDKAEECSEKQYNRFLVQTPLLCTPFQTPLSTSGIRGFGSYHMQYWMDEQRLMAVGVVDVLPSGLSSVYLFYDPDFSFLGLGTYSALRELGLTRLIRQSIPSFRFYYMGFYIHSCPKMRYKGKFLPSELLCPEVKTWHPIASAVQLLDKSKYSRLEPDLRVMDREGQRISDQNISVLIAGLGRGTFFRYRILKADSEDLPDKESDVREYASLVGQKAVRSILLYLE